MPKTDAQNRTFDVIVAGVGSVGSAACYHAAKRGARVLGLEQFEIPHKNGSHHGHSRMIRQAYFEHPDYVPLLRRAYELWHELRQADARDFFYVTGGLYIGAMDGTIVPGSLRAAKEHGLEHSILSADEISARFPLLKPNPEHAGFCEDLGGFLVPELAVSAHADGAVAQGAVIQTGERLISWKAHTDHVSVKTESGEYSTEKLVITAGAWTGAIAKDLGIDLEVTRQSLAWFEPLGDPGQYSPENFPCWFVETDSPFGHYGFPMLPGDPGLKIAIHKPGPEMDPEAPLDADVPISEINSLHKILEEYFPGCAGDVVHSCSCKYTNSPDGHFVLGAHPEHERVSIACGLSGHGFKFSSVLGEALADLALEGETSLPIDFLSPQRFG